MVSLLFAINPAMPLIWPFAFVLLILIAGIFVTVTRCRGKRSEQDRRAGLGLLAILSGPLVGASLAWLRNTLGDVLPADVGYTYILFTIFGGVAGFVTGVSFAITALVAPRNPGGDD